MEIPENANTTLFERLEKYPWKDDVEFQSGLTAILGPDPEALGPDRLQDLTLHARCFYFSRKFDTSINFEEYKGWRESIPTPDLSTLMSASDVGSLGDEQVQQSLEQQHSVAEAQPLTFAEVMELVQSGKPIPGVKDIPDTVLEGKGTEASESKRQKPWEVAGKKPSGLFDTPMA